MTAVELLTFLPNVIHCSEAIYRFVSNGASRNSLWTIINTNRDLPEVYSTNRVGADMCKTMRLAGYENWTPTTHKDWLGENKEGWDETCVDVKALHQSTMAGLDEVMTFGVPFKDLAVDVRAFPQGFDALDLTRMVQHCISNDEGQWIYPRDYDALLKSLGGPVAIEARHLDGRVFKRWNDVTPPPPRIREEGESGVEKDVKDTNMQKKGRRALASTVREHKLASMADYGQVTLVSAQQHRQGEQEERGAHEVSKLQSSLLAAKPGGRAVIPRDYSRTVPQYVRPPSWAKAPSQQAIALAFASQAAVGEVLVDSAYAFGGPRHEPPYRLLHRIGQPNAADTSGWAENLRWAQEQRESFHATYTEGWNESPEHMDAICQSRQDQVWASEELLAQLRDL
jgi:hypothetical protein